ncbi:unnamed protein product, partial [Nesidiocoris tenuis]
MVRHSGQSDDHGAVADVVQRDRSVAKCQPCRQQRVQALLIGAAEENRFVKHSHADYPFAFLRYFFDDFVHLCKLYFDMTEL